MADNFKNIRALLGPDKPLYDDSDPNAVRFPAYEQMLNNARRNYVRDVQAPDYVEKFRDLETSPYNNKLNRSEPTVLDKIADSSVSKEFLNKLHEENILKSDKDPQAYALDRTGINNEIIKSMVRDTNPSLAYRLDNGDLRSKDEAEDNIKALYHEAEKAVPTNKKVPLDFLDPKTAAFAGVYRGNDDSIGIAAIPSNHPGHLGQFVSAPFHERLHAQYAHAGFPSIGSEKTPDLASSKKLDVDMPQAQSSHIAVPARGHIAPGDFENNLNAGQRTVNVSPGESGAYFKIMRALAGKPVPEKE